jgi:oligoendopeptidase F
MVLLRSEVKDEDIWNIEELYPNFQSWKHAFKQVSPNDQSPWPELLSYKGRLGESPKILLEALTTSFSLSRQLEKLYTYAHLRHDEDITNPEHKNGYEKALTLLHLFAESTSWMEPEILSLPQNVLDEFLQSPVLAKYAFHLEKLVRLRKHTLSEEQEALLALAHRALEAPYKAFSALNNADFKFGTIEDSSGNKIELTHGSYQLCLRSRDRPLREKAFKTIHGKYAEYENTLCELIHGQVQSHLFESKARHYQSCLEAALKPKNIDLDVYHALIKAVRGEISALHDYTSLRKKVLGLDSLHLYDLHVPLTAELDIKMDYAEGEQAVIESVAPLGEEYQNILREGLRDKRWVDRYENKNKRSGAYSSGCYDSMPYILMNFKGILNDVFTLAHEAGHSMHSYLSRKSQPYHYSSYPIFVAEVASTFNEELLMTYLKSRAKTKEEKIYLINQQIETIRTTLFRQTLFAEFELLIHELVEQNTPLTPELLKNEYIKLNRVYFGPNVTIDEEVSSEWSRIPHFYYDFYVYQYATGISASIALADRVLKGGKNERDHYLSFLKGGCSHYPIDLLKMAGVDMRSPEPVKAAIDKFRTLVKELTALF